MAERGKSRKKEANREVRTAPTETAFQLNSRQNRNYLSAKMVSIIRTNDSNNEFSPQELVNIESILRDEMQTNPWLLNVCNAVAEEGVVVSKEELNLFNKCLTDGQDVCVNQSEVEELHKELQFLKQRIHVLRYLFNDLIQKLTEFRKNVSIIKLNTNQINSSDIWTQFRIKLTESLDIIRNDINCDLTVEDPKDVSKQILNILNDKLVSIDGIEDPNQWLGKQLDDLSLTDGNQRQGFESFNNQFCLRLEAIHKSLSALNKECLRIKQYYDKEVRDEMSWRRDLNTILSHLQNDYNLDVIHLNSIQTQTNSLFTKKRLIEEYSQLFETIESQECDELRALIDTLSERIKCLTTSDTQSET